MSEWIVQKDAFRELAIQEGVVHPTDLTRALPLGYSVPKERILRWLEKLREVPESFASQRRYVNRFKIGADPEFVFSAMEGTKAYQLNAMDYQLHQGLAFGADNNGRLVEVRPYPSRSVVAVCASILATLRWLAVWRPMAFQHSWQAGAFLYGDGVGGHIHFGRKRPTREAEITALDRISDVLLALGVFPAAEVEARRRGDARGQIYGRNHDFRLQNHGYEYRTLPSWLDSPQIAFLTITLAKLAVYNPLLAMKLRGRDNLLAKLYNYLAYYKDADDDARLACVLLSRGLPVHAGRDFKGRWGLAGMNGYLRPRDVQYLPLAVKPSPEDITEMFEHLLLEKPLLPRLPAPTWTPSAPPKGYRMCIDAAVTHQVKGLGEMIWDLCCHQDADIRIGPTQRDASPTQIVVSSSLARILDRGKKMATAKVMRVMDLGMAMQIMIPATLRDGAAAKHTRDFLLNGMFPLWDVKHVKEDSFKKWTATVNAVPEGKNFAGTMLFPGKEEG